MRILPLCTAGVRINVYGLHPALHDLFANGNATAQQLLVTPGVINKGLSATPEQGNKNQ
jgi:hypothetical protein